MMHEDLDEAIRRIDEAFGAGYAKGHPELVAALVQAAAFDRVAKAITSNPVAGDLAPKIPTRGADRADGRAGGVAAAPQLTANGACTTTTGELLVCRLLPDGNHPSNNQHCTVLRVSDWRRPTETFAR